jgi:hypothetical protein
VEIDGGMPAFLLAFPPGTSPEVGERLQARIAGVDAKARRVGLTRFPIGSKTAR